MKELTAKPNPARKTMLYANRVRNEIIARTDHYSVSEIEVNAGLSYSFFEITNPKNIADESLFRKAVPIIDENGQLLMQTSDLDDWYFSIDLSAIIPEGWSASIQRLTDGKPNSLGLIMFHPDYEHEVAGAHRLTNADLKDFDAEQCTETKMDTFLAQGAFQCGREVGHLGQHQTISTGYSYSWNDSGSSGSPFGAIGFKATCPKCGFVDRGDASGVKTCFLCSFWEEQRSAGGKRFVIDGQHYRPGAGGFGGRKFKIKENNGEIWTGELFTQGEIPSWLISDFPDTAVFLKV